MSNPRINPKVFQSLINAGARFAPAVSLIPKEPDTLSKGRWKAGWRTIGGQRVYFRSRWESNYARFLEWRKGQGQIVKWEHEPEAFWFGHIKRGTVSYLPDFRVTFPGGRVEYHETKGYMDGKSKTKIKRMAKYHPDVTLVVVNEKTYKKIESAFCRIVPEWEGSR